MKRAVVTGAVVRNLGRPRLERNLPRRDGWSLEGGGDADVR